MFQDFSPTQTNDAIRNRIGNLIEANQFPKQYIANAENFNHTDIAVANTLQCKKESNINS